MPWLDEHVESEKMESVAEMQKQVNELSVSDNDGKEGDAMDIDELEKEESEASADKLKEQPATNDKPKEESAPYAYFISRGAEMCDVSEGVCKYTFEYVCVCVCMC